MTATRDIPKTGTISGSEHVEAVSDSVNALYKSVGGRALNVAGTNAITFNFPVTDGLQALDGVLQTILIPVNTNTAAVTITVNNSSTGTKPIVDENGVALTGGELVAGKAYTIFFLTGSDHWRVLGVNAGTSISGSDGFPPVHWYQFTTVGVQTWTVPYNCYCYIHLIGGGGTGAVGTGSTTAANTGGGGGAYCFKRALITGGTVITLNVASGGAAILPSAAPAGGNPGGNTTAVASGFISMGANGGSGGNRGTKPVAGASGGIATGGDINIQGGNSGAANTASATGGAGVNLNNQGLANGTPDFPNPTGMMDSFAIKVMGLPSIKGVDNEATDTETYGGGTSGNGAGESPATRAGGNGAALIGISIEVT